MGNISSINPATEEVLMTFAAMSRSEVGEAIERTDSAYQIWRRTPIADRLKKVEALSDYLSMQRDALAALITLEMGKPIVQALAEIDKCASACLFYSKHGESFLHPTAISLDGASAFVRYDPIGILLAIMPWNFPFWQLIRPGIPAIVAGNTILLKHAPNVPQCALALERAFRECGFPQGVLTTLIADTDMVPEILADDRVQAVTLTGSERAGSAVAALAGFNIKRSVMELGGSDAFIVCADADIEQAASLAVRARTQNAGQSCIAAKRFLIAREVFDPFLAAFTHKIGQLCVGNPADAKTDIGPLARLDLVEALERQVQASVAVGATIVIGGSRIDRPGFFFEPTILTNVPVGSPVWSEETFGPVAAVMPFESEEEAIAAANDNRYGLGATVCTRDGERALRLAGALDVGMVFVNAIVASDPRLPFGGVKKSGYGRELSQHGAREFTNIKTVYLADA